MQIHYMGGGGDKGLRISNLKYLYIEDSNSQKIKINYGDEIIIPTTKIYSCKSSAYIEVEYTSIICDMSPENYKFELSDDDVLVYFYQSKEYSDQEVNKKLKINNIKTSTPPTVYYSIIQIDSIKNIEEKDIFNALAYRGGSRAIYSNNKNLLCDSTRSITVPDPGGMFDTLVINGTFKNQGDGLSNYLDNNININLNSRGYIIVNNSLNMIPSLNINEYNSYIVDNGNFILFRKTYNVDKELLNDYSKATIINNENNEFSLNSDIENLTFGWFYNFGLFLQVTELSVSRVYNFGVWRSSKKLTLNSIFSNNGTFEINNDVFAYHRIANDENGIIKINQNGNLYFDIIDTNNSKAYDTLITNKGSLFDMKDKTSIKLINLNNIDYLFKNYSVIKIDGEISSNVPITSINYKNGLIYLENDSNLNKNIIFKNNSTIISYTDKYDPVFTDDDVENERYLNIKKMMYYKDDKEINLYENLENVKDCIFELNSLDIEAATLNSITFLLDMQYNINHQTDKTIDEILRLIKFGLLKDWPYTPNIPTQIIKPPNYPSKPKYRPDYSCF